MPAEIQSKILAHAGVLTLWVNGRIDDTKLNLYQFKEILRDVFELDWQGDLTTLPFEKFKLLWLDEPLWRIRTRRMHARVKALGFDNLNYGLDQAAILNMWIDLLDFDKPEQIGRNATCCGSIAMMEYLIDEREVLALDEYFARLSGRSGHLELLKWFADRMPDGSWNHRAMDDAASKGHLDVVKWLHENRTEGCSVDAMNWAAKNGHLAVVQWLHSNRTEGCTSGAMNMAAFHGHLDVVKWLLENRTEGNLAEAAKHAAWRNQLAVIKHIQKLAPDAITGTLVDEAASSGSRLVLEWLINDAGVQPTASMISAAVDAGKLDMLSWFCKHMPEVFRAHPASKVGNQAADAVFDWFDRDDLPNFRQDVLRLAIQERQVLVAKWLLQHLAKDWWGTDVLEQALELVGTE
ncbi:hypothetical protein HK105_206409 [Polyrhizophydium stewartii]|uniref:Ankyrin repeat protein n=1 Tax=Polyrhizophydium stewartii TaxID=2732419 RepID=A0ABR4N3M7_9FUNG